MNELEKRLLSVLLVCVLCASVIACGAKQDPMEKVKDLDFTRHMDKSASIFLFPPGPALSDLCQYKPHFPFRTIH